MTEFTSELIVQKCQETISHAWMVRTFIKHCDEVEDFPELMGITRSVFDLACALETRVDNPADYLRMLGKKMSRFRTAVSKFQDDYKKASLHTNFEQAAISIAACEKELSELLDRGQKLILSQQSENEQDLN